jgi:hypothetical protein
LQQTNPANDFGHGGATLLNAAHRYASDVANFVRDFGGSAWLAPCLRRPMSSAAPISEDEGDRASFAGACAAVSKAKSLEAAVHLDGYHHRQNLLRLPVV